MVFPQHDYKTLYPDDFKNWDEWVFAINEAEAYCNKIKEKDIFEFTGWCSDTDLPAFHPYWKYVSGLHQVRRINEIKAKLALCIRDHSLIKVYFNQTETIETITQRIKYLQSKVPIFENVLTTTL